MRKLSVDPDGKATGAHQTVETFGVKPDEGGRFDVDSIETAMVGGVFVVVVNWKITEKCWYGRAKRYTECDCSSCKARRVEQGFIVASD